jgi:RNA polymerase-binding transcription factor DksA
MNRAEVQNMVDAEVNKFRRHFGLREVETSAQREERERAVELRAKEAKRLRKAEKRLEEVEREIFGGLMGNERAGEAAVVGYRNRALSLRG